MCGQKPPCANPSVREFLHETTHELTHWDGKLPATLKALLLKPGLLTEDFLAGRRARWLPPLRLYLICSIGYFLSGPLIEAVTHRSVKQVARFTLTDPAGADSVGADSVGAAAAGADSAGADSVGAGSLKVGRTEQDSTFANPASGAEAADSAWITRLIGRDRIQRIINEPETFNAALAASFPKAMFVLMPLFAWLTWLTWRGTGIRYPAHLYFSLHLHAAGFASMVASKLASIVDSLTVDIVVGLAVLAYGTWYTVAAVRRVFGGSSGGVTLRMTLVGIVYSGFFLIVMFALIGYTLLTA
jgi:CubicO group peptidase (beta-lactamase class C family)